MEMELFARLCVLQSVGEIQYLRSLVIMQSFEYTEMWRYIV